MVLKKNGVIVNGYVPTYANKKIAIAIDSSKTNTAIVVGDTHGNVIDDYEIEGKNDVDVLALCYNQRRQLKLLFEGAKIDSVGIEDIITKKSDNRTSGIDVHKSRFKITAVFMSIIMFFQDAFEITPLQINNMSWKNATLPEEYRKKTHKKGSLDYEKDIGSKYAYRSDDVTDAVHIYEYMCMKLGYNNVYKVEEPCQTNKLYSYGFISTSVVIPTSAMHFELNPELSIKQNCDTMVNAMSSGCEMSYATVAVKDIPIEEIYKRAIGKRHDVYEEYVYLVCKVKESL